MTAAVYTRYSSEAQREASLEDQERNCRAYAERSGWSVGEAFSDRARSGATAERPGYQALLEGLAAGRFEVLLVDDLSRLSRDAAELQTLAKRLRFHGIGLVAVADGVDTVANPKSGGLVLGIKGAINQDFLRDLAEKTHRGLEGRIRAGFSAGGQAYGYRSEAVFGDPPRVDRHGQPLAIGYRRVVEPTEAAVVRRILEWYADGWSARRIAEALNAEGVAPPGRRWRNRTRVAARTWSASAIEGSVPRGLGILNNEGYLGRLVWNRFEWRRDPEGKRVPVLRPRSEWMVVEAPELRIVSDELWRAVKQEQARRRRPQAMQRRRKYLLSGLLRCGLCGASMAIRNHHGYGCMTRANRGKDLCANSGVINRKALEAAVLALLGRWLYRPEVMERLTAAVREELLASERRRRARGDGRQRLAEKRREVEQVAESLRRCGEDGRPLAAEYLERDLERLLEEKAALEREAGGETVRVLDALPRLGEMVQAQVQAIAQGVEQGEMEDARAGLVDLVETIEVRPGEEDGRPCHVVRVKGALSRVFRLLARRQISVVAGAGFEPATFGL